MTWTRCEILLGEALTPDREDDPRVCSSCGGDDAKRSATAMPGIWRYRCGCGAWWVS